MLTASSATPRYVEVSPRLPDAQRISSRPAAGTVVDGSDDVAVEVGPFVEAARGAFDAYSPLPAPQLGAVLQQIAAVINANAGELKELAADETGLGTVRLDTELARCLGQLRFFAEFVASGQIVDAVIDTAPTHAPRESVPDLRRMLVPLGPAAIFAASNFPFAFGIAGTDTAAALAAGCPVIVKSHPAQPRLSRRLGEVLYQATRETLPAGWITVLPAGDVETGRQLVTAPDIDVVAFTGSTAAGRALANAAAARPNPIPVYAEMGSINPFVVTPEAATEHGSGIATGLSTVILGSAGQLCTKPGLILLVDDPAGNQLVDTLAAQLDDAAPMRMLDSRIASGYDHRLAELRACGARMLLNRSSQDAELTRSAHLASISSVELRCNETFAEEVFGPAALICWCADVDDLMATVQDSLPGSLTGTVHLSTTEGKSEDGVGARLIRMLANRVGRVVLNGYPTGLRVSHAIHHGGPHPATTYPAASSVGSSAVARFQRPVCYQNVNDSLLPAQLRNDNPDGLLRRINGHPTTADVR